MQAFLALDFRLQGPNIDKVGRLAAMQALLALDLADPNSSSAIIV
jgi:hypothetical protein